MFNYFGYPVLTTQQMLQMYSLHNGWNLFIVLATIGLVMGIIGFAVGLAVATPAETSQSQNRTPSHHHAA